MISIADTRKRISSTRSRHGTKRGGDPFAATTFAAESVASCLRRRSEATEVGARSAVSITAHLSQKFTF